MRRLLVLAAAIAVPLVAADTAIACSCVTPKPREMLKEHDGAFIGRLVAVREVGSFGADFVYRVGRVFNGGPGLHRGRRVKVRSTRDDASCGLPRRQRQLYGLFVDRKEGRWHGNVCLTVAPAKLRRAAEGSSSAAGPGGGAGCG